MNRRSLNHAVRKFVKTINVDFVMQSISCCYVQQKPFYRTRKKFSCNAAMMDATDRVVIAGGGIAGLSAALSLTKVCKTVPKSHVLCQCEIPVTVLEKSNGLREEGTSLGLLANAWRALDALSIGEDLRINHPRCKKFSSVR